MKVIITGISGFIGSNLYKYLASSYKIFGVSRKPIGPNVFGFDDLSQDLLNDVYAFVHLSGKAHDLSKTTSNEEYFQLNTN